MNPCGKNKLIRVFCVQVVTKRAAIPLDDNEGIYVRDIKSGQVRAVQGETYLLTQDEELWAKELPAGVEALITQVIHRQLILAPASQN